MGHVLDATAGPQPPGRLITVGIPVFNGKSLLRNCLQSVINSTLPRDCFEIIVADDGSSEPETLAVLSEFERRLAAHPGFFRVISLGTNSGGAARPRNCILDEATGDYVFFVDSDDTIGTLALEKVAKAVARTPADWMAVNQVPVNGRAAACTIRQPHVEVPRAKALATLTVHKLFRRAEIERQQLRFDERLPSGQDVSFAFAFIVNAARFLMLGGYDYYYLTQHGGNPNEPAHLSRRANTPEALIEKNETILRAMLTTLRDSALPEVEQREILCQVALPRVLLHQRYLKAVVNAGPEAGPRALHRLSELLGDPLVANLDPAEVRGVTGEHLRLIAASDWPGLMRLMRPEVPQPPPPKEPASGRPGRSSRIGAAARWVKRGRHVVDVASGRVRHRRVVNELTRWRRAVENLGEAQRQLHTELRETRDWLRTDLRAEFQRSVADLGAAHRRLHVDLQAEFQLRDMLAADVASTAGAAITPLNPGWQLSPQAMHEVLRHVLLNRPEVVVECGSGASTMWIGRALRHVGGGRLISLESERDWIAIVAGLVEHEGLSSVDVRLAPMEPIQLAGREQPWYSAAALADVEEIDLLLVDGPPGRTSELARYPALPALRDKLRPGAVVMLDDCHRTDERTTLQKWLAEVPGLSLLRQVDHLAVMKIS
jgi:predicted O-methyltransferase YrrM